MDLFCPYSDSPAFSFLFLKSSFVAAMVWNGKGKKTESIIPTFKGTNLQSIREKDSPVLLQSTL